MSTASSAVHAAASENFVEARGGGTAVPLDANADADVDMEVLQLLDEPQEWSAFSRPDPRQLDVWESNLLIEGMHCAACALTIEDALKAVPGVQQADVSAATRRAAAR